MRYREIQPAAALAGHIECYWMLQSNGSAANLPSQRILPDGCVEMIVNFAEPFAQRNAAGAFERQPLHFVVGQMQAPVEIKPTGSVKGLGIRFHPAGARKILGIPMQELSGRMVPLEALQHDLVDAVRSACGAGETRERLRIIEAALLKRAAQGSDADPAVWGALKRLLETDGCVMIEELTAQAGVSRRQLERKFQDWVGLTPKVLGRILRFQRVFKALESGAANWAEVAADCGYYDQSHLIRDFRQFAGECPSALNVPQDSLTEIFMRKNRMTHFSKTRSAN